MGICPATRRLLGGLRGKQAFVARFQMGESALLTHRASAGSKGKFSCRGIFTRQRARGEMKSRLVLLTAAHRDLVGKKIDVTASCPNGDRDKAVSHIQT